MEDKFYSIYGNLDGTREGNESLMNNKESNPSLGAPRVGVGSEPGTHSQHVRVLWDIENLAVPRQLGGTQTVKRVLGFLSGLGLSGEGIDCRVTAFLDPSGGAVSKGTVKELDQCAVEMVWVSGKREDADRKLGNRLLQDCSVR